MIVSAYVNAPWRNPATYYVPENLQDKIHLYQRVIVSKGGEKLPALISHIRTGVSLHEKKDLQPIDRVIDSGSILNQEQFDLAERVAAHYLTKKSDVLFAMIPSGRQSREQKEKNPEPVSLPSLNEDQAKIVDSVLNQKPANLLHMHLIHGVTGSGKTRVYIELIQKYLKKNLGAMLLLPEIALSYQFLEKLKPLFGKEMAILHSGLSASFRLAEYKRALSGEAKFIVGTRSAVFAPVQDLGLIIIDEEHDSSYKEHYHAGYNAKWVAHNRLSHNGAWPYSLPLSLISGSATPLVETMHYAKNKHMNLHTLEKRATGFHLPVIHIPRYNPAEPNADLFSPLLLQKMREHLDANNQVILLLNRRGYSNYAFCPQCEKPVLCPRCSVSLTFHKNKNTQSRLKCHLCGYEKKYSPSCEVCSSRLKLLGKGIQKAEDAMEFHFPGVEYARMDRDSATETGYIEDVLEAMSRRRLQVLIGTQMIAKGFDLPGVTLVGILNADIGLSLPDFRSGERVFQLLVQAAGRAGRHEHGEVVLQTGQPSHYAVLCAQNYDYDGFYRQEIELRKSMFFPPFCRLLRIMFRSSKEDAAWHFAHRVFAYIQEVETENGLFSEEAESMLPEQIYGPLEAPLYKVRDEYRIHIVAKDRSLNKLRKFGAKVNSYCRSQKNKMESVATDVDFDPTDLL